MALNSGKILAEQIRNTDTLDQTKKRPMQTQISESYRMCRRHKYFKMSDSTQIISQKGITDSTEVLINQECATIRIKFESYLNMRPFLVGQLTKERERQGWGRGHGQRAQIQVKWAFRNYCTYVQREKWGVGCGVHKLLVTHANDRQTNHSRGECVHPAHARREPPTRRNCCWCWFVWNLCILLFLLMFFPILFFLFLHCLGIPKGVSSLCEIAAGCECVSEWESANVPLLSTQHWLTLHFFFTFSYYLLCDYDFVAAARSLALAYNYFNCVLPLSHTHTRTHIEKGALSLPLYSDADSRICDSQPQRV